MSSVNLVDDSTVVLMDTVNLNPIQKQMIIDTNLLKLYYGFRRCYSADIENFTDKYKVQDNGCLTDEDREKVNNYIRRMRKTPHTSPLEHVQMTFHIYNYSRVASHQDVRHRIASYSQQSQRYVEDNLTVIVPPSIKENPKALEIYNNFMLEMGTTYRNLIDECSIPREDARFVLAGGISTAIVVSKNLRALINYFSERCCYRAQWEIRNVAYKMLAICKEMYPAVFENVGAKCVIQHKCPEAEPCSVKPFLAKK